MARKIPQMPAFPFCCRCEKKVVVRDVLGIGWCEDHEHHGRLINWLEAHDWPYLQCDPYIISPGKWSAVQLIMFGEGDDRVWFALAFIEYLETECDLSGYATIKEAVEPYWQQSMKYWQGVARKET
jgi:hypothetical protein